MSRVRVAEGALSLANQRLSTAIRGSSATQSRAAVIGIGPVVAVFAGLLSMASGFRLALRASAGNAIVLEKGAMSELGPRSAHRR